MKRPSVRIPPRRVASSSYLCILESERVVAIHHREGTHDVILLTGDILTVLRLDVHRWYVGELFKLLGQH